MDIVEHLRDLKLDVAANEIESLRQQLAKRPRIDESMLKGATDTAALIVNELRQQLAECQKDILSQAEHNGKLLDRLAFADETNRLLNNHLRLAEKQLATVTKERDELVAAAKGLAFGMDWNHGTHAQIYRPMLLAALAKLGADKTALQELDEYRCKLRDELCGVTDLMRGADKGEV